MTIKYILLKVHNILYHGDIRRYKLNAHVGTYHSYMYTYTCILAITTTSYYYYIVKGSYG